MTDLPFDDSQGTIQAAILLAMPVLTLAILSSFHEASTRQRVRRAFGFGAVMVLVSFFAAFQSQELGYPIPQLLISLLCLIATPWMRRPRTHFVVGSLVMVMGIFLSTHYTYLVKNRYVGAEDWIQLEGPIFDRARQDALHLIAGAAGTEVYDFEPQFLYPGEELYERYSSDWDSGVNEQPTQKAAPLWHSWLTKLYARSSVDVALWYPGGKFTDDPQLEWRVVSLFDSDP